MYTSVQNTISNLFIFFEINRHKLNVNLIKDFETFIKIRFEIPENKIHILFSQFNSKNQKTSTIDAIK